MTSSDMQDTPAGRRAARADGPRSSQPKRRTFTAAYKMAMIEKYDAATEPGAKGVLLRGEGLYDSHISYWRKARDSGALKSSAVAVPAVADKRRPGMAAENERLRKRLAKAEVKLGQTRAALDIMGKAFALLDALRERGSAEAARQVSEDTFDLLEPVTGVQKACDPTGLPTGCSPQPRSGRSRSCGWCMPGFRRGTGRVQRRGEQLPGRCPPAGCDRNSRTWPGRTGGRTGCGPGPTSPARPTGLPISVPRQYIE